MYEFVLLEFEIMTAIFSNVPQFEIPKLVYYVPSLYITFIQFILLFKLNYLTCCIYMKDEINIRVIYFLNLNVF